MFNGCHGLLDILNYVTEYYFSNAIAAVQKEICSVEKGMQLEYIVKHGRKHFPAFIFFLPPHPTPPRSLEGYCVYLYFIQEFVVIFALFFYMFAIV